MSDPFNPQDGIDNAQTVGRGLFTPSVPDAQIDAARQAQDQAYALMQSDMGPSLKEQLATALAASIPAIF